MLPRRRSPSAAESARPAPPARMRQIRLPGGGGAADRAGPGRAGQGRAWPRAAAAAKQALGDSLKLHVVNLLRQLKSFLGRKEKRKGERTVDKPSWYCSRGYSACRVKSVV
ncbi:small integral membrane protein 20 isoform X3 [Larus michahellis]|uniref:small integral membrane protein 20 isoform X3 n=1 Tax=Larus michahellis TaxID=119627 RepID=UPI003D9ADBCB